MANTCCVTHVFYVDDRKDKKILVKMRNLLRAAAKEADHTERSPLNLAIQKASGKDVPLEVAKQGRDYFTAVDVGVIHPWDDTRFTLEEETAWRACSGWDTLLTYFPGVSHAYVEFEPGCRVFEKVDDEGFFANREYIVFTDEDTDEDAAYGMEVGAADGLISYLKETFGLGGEYHAEEVDEVIQTCKDIETARNRVLEIYRFE